MSEINISKSLNKAYKKLCVDRQSFDNFCHHLADYLYQISMQDSEDKLKTDLLDFLKQTFYSPDKYKVSPTGRRDFTIHLGTSISDPVGVIFEIKTPGNIAEMIRRDNLNKKALHELLLYYLQERVTRNNLQLKNLVITDGNEFFIFDAHEFERIFFANKKLLKDYKEFVKGGKSSATTEFFYKEIASKVIATSATTLTYTWFDIRKYKNAIATGNERHILELYKIFSPEHLLKRPFQTDSNSLNTKFYNELLYIIGLEEAEDKVNNKRIITRCSPAHRNPASILENTISILKNENWIDYISDVSLYGDSMEEQIFNVALTLSIQWINRILFLKLLEGRLVSYHKGDFDYAFLHKDKIADYSDLNKLFFRVLAKPKEDRAEYVNSQFGNIPYLNSSLFEISKLERETIRINNLDKLYLPLFKDSILREREKQHPNRLTTLEYLLDFLNGYNFANDDTGEITESTQSIINASVLGLIFEKLNGYKDGAVFTPGSITMYMSKEAIQAVVTKKFNDALDWQCATYDELRNREIVDLIQANQIIDSIKICDPAVGSGHFLVAVLNEIIRIKYDLGILLDWNQKRIKRQDWNLDVENDELIITDSEGESFIYLPGNPECQRVQEAIFNEKRKIIENCLFGVDINPNAANICRLRLWIELLKNSYYTKESGYTELQTLPNIDINIKVGNALIHRFPVKLDMSEILRNTDISFEKYKEAVAQYKQTSDKQIKSEMSDIIQAIKTSLVTRITDNEPKIKERNKLAQEQTNLSSNLIFEPTLKETQRREKKVALLQTKIDKLDDEIKKINNRYSNAVEWRIDFPEVLDDAGNFIGFDCVIGNPPYVSLQKMGIDSSILNKMDYATYDKSGDLYCMFYELGLQLLLQGGLLSYITSNKWMRAAYGKSLREHIARHSNPTHLIDFGNNKVFDKATVFVNILTLLNTTNQHSTLACTLDDGLDMSKLADFVNKHSRNQSFDDGDEWSIMSESDKLLKKKIEAAGTPIRELQDIHIRYGIKTGCNEAFVISGKQRDEILANCLDEAERSRTRDLIVPLKEGRDITRNHIDDSDKWLIATHNGIQDKLDNVEIEKYPAIKTHLFHYIDKLINRKDKGDTPYNLRNCAYWKEFSLPKIVWGNLNKRAGYALVEDEVYINAPACMLVPGDKYLLTILNSRIADYYIKKIGVVRNGGYIEYKPMYVEQIPIPSISDEAKLEIDQIIDAPLQEDEKDRALDKVVASLYNLTSEDIEWLSES